MSDEVVPEPGIMETPNGRIAWWSFEGGDGIPAVLVHGGPGDGCNPSKGPRMQIGRRIYMYDQLGCGMSDPISDPTSWSDVDYADELALFIDSIGEERVVLIGASWGAGLIVSYIRHHGTSKVAGLILASPFFSASGWKDDMVTNLRSMGDTEYLRIMEYLAGRAPRETYVSVMKEYYSRFLFARACNREIALGAAEETPNGVYRALCGENDFECTGTLASFDVTDVLPTISVPVLYLCGDSDEVTIPTMLDYRESTPGSRLAVVPYAGHALGFEQFDLYRMNIAAFLSENGLRRRNPIIEVAANTRSDTAQRPENLRTASLKLFLPSRKVNRHEISAHSSTRYTERMRDVPAISVDSETFDIGSNIVTLSPSTRGANTDAVMDIVSVIPFISERIPLLTAS